MVFINNNPTRTNEGGNLTTACTYDSNPAAYVVIQKENNVIRTSCDKSKCLHTFSNVSRNDSGLYKCIGNNTQGSDEANISVIVQCEYMTFFVYINIWKLWENQQIPRKTNK